MSTRNDTVGSVAWLQFTIRIIALALMIGGGFAALYARICVVEYKVDEINARLTKLEDRQLPPLVEIETDKIAGAR